MYAAKLVANLTSTKLLKLFKRTFNAPGLLSDMDRTKNLLKWVSSSGFEEKSSLKIRKLDFFFGFSLL